MAGRERETVARPVAAGREHGVARAAVGSRERGGLGDRLAGQVETTTTMVRPILILSPFLRRWAW